jgi:hypothetical protein
MLDVEMPNVDGQRIEELLATSRSRRARATEEPTL